MDRNVYQTLEYDKILRQLADLAVSAQAREALLALEPMQDLGLIAQHSAEIAQAREILEKGGTPPLAQMEGMETILCLLYTSTGTLPDCAGNHSADIDLRPYVPKGL